MEPLILVFWEFERWEHFSRGEKHTNRKFVYYAYELIANLIWDHDKEFFGVLSLIPRYFEWNLCLRHRIYQEIPLIRRTNRALRHEPSMH